MQNVPTTKKEMVERVIRDHPDMPPRGIVATVKARYGQTVGDSYVHAIRAGMRDGAPVVDVPADLAGLPEKIAPTDGQHQPASPPLSPADAVVATLKMASLLRAMAKQLGSWAELEKVVVALATMPEEV